MRIATKVNEVLNEVLLRLNQDLDVLVSPELSASAGEAVKPDNISVCVCGDEDD